VQEEEAVTITIEEPVTLTFALRYADSSNRSSGSAVSLERRLWRHLCVQAEMRTLPQLLELLHQGDATLADRDPAAVAECAAGHDVRSLLRSVCVQSHRTPPPLQHLACRARLPRFGTELRTQV
jgi:hypothetical protein